MVRYSTLTAASFMLAAAHALALPAAAGLIARGGTYNTSTVNPTGQRLTTKYNTFNSTVVAPNSRVQEAQDAPAAPVTLSLVNNFQGAGQINAYISAKDPSNGQMFFIKADGTAYTIPNPNAGDPTTQIDPAAITIPLGAFGESTDVTLNQYVTGARVWFGVGDLWFGANYGDAGPGVATPWVADPNDRSANINWGFTEFNWDATFFFANLSFVDFVGLVISLVMTDQAGAEQKAIGVPADGVSKVCDGLRAQHDSDGQPWDTLCINDQSGNLLRVISPAKLPADDSRFADYWTDYVDQVYDAFASNSLTINTPTAGDLTGTYNAGSGNLEFPGYSYAKPNGFDIWGCADGPYYQPPDETARAIVGRLCAAFQRTTYLLDGGNQQPNGVTDTTQYYANAPTNHYSRVVHATEVDGRGYAFPFDDVIPAGGVDLAGTVASGTAQKLTIYVGANPA